MGKAEVLCNGLMVPRDWLVGAASNDLSNSPSGRVDKALEGRPERSHSRMPEHPPVSKVSRLAAPLDAGGGAAHRCRVRERHRGRFRRRAALWLARRDDLARLPPKLGRT